MSQFHHQVALNVHGQQMSDRKLVENNMQGSICTICRSYAEYKCSPNRAVFWYDPNIYLRKFIAFWKL